MPVTAVLSLVPLTRSIAFRPYLAAVGGKPILALLAEHLLTRSGAARFLVLYHYESERALLAEALANTAAELRFTPHFSELQAVAELLPEFEDGQIAFLQLGCALAPADLLLRVTQHHLNHGNSYTLVDGAPGGCSLSLIQAATIKSLVQIADRFGFSAVDDAVRRLQLLGERVGGTAATAIRATPFNLPVAYAVAPETLPLAVTIDKATCRLLDQAVATAGNCNASPDSPAVLCALKPLQVELLAARCALASNCILAPAPRTSPKERILYLSIPSAFSGAEQALCSMVKFLDPTRFQPFALTAHEGVFAEKLRAAGAEVVCPDRDVGTPEIESFTYALSLLQEIRPSILHLNGCTSLPFLAAAAVSGIPVVQHVRNGDLVGFQSGLVQAQAIVAISEFLQREALRLPIRAERVHIVYDEVDSEVLDPALFDKSQCREQFQLPPQARIALMIARMVPNKRYDLMLEAAAAIKSQVPDFLLVLKGDVYDGSHHTHAIHNLIQKLDLESSIRWMDFVPDIRSLLAAADLLVLCSDREGLGSCVVEAMSMALPVVVTNTGGTHEIVESGVRGGFVVPGSDPAALAARVTELLNDEPLRHRLGSAGRAFVRTHLDARISARAIMEIYTTLLTGC
jgi:glycosyltransferase involved in cell wall biosynthesis